MSTDTGRFTSELRERLSLDSLHSSLDFDTVLTSSRRARPRRALVASSAVVGTLTAVVLAGPPLVGWRNPMAEAAHRARLSDIDGITNDLSAPLHVAWQAHGSTLFLGSGSNGTILVESNDGYQVLDSVTGEVRWSAQGGADHWSHLLAHGGTPVGSKSQADGSELVLYGDATDGTVQVLDAVAGEVVSASSSGWSGSWAEMIDGVVIVAGIDDEGFLAARRWDATTGEVAWATGVRFRCLRTSTAWG